MLLHVRFLGVPCFIDILRCQPPHRGVVLVKQPRVSRGHQPRPVPRPLRTGSPTRVCSSNEAGAEASAHSRVSVELRRGGSVDVLLSVECLLDEQISAISDFVQQQDS